MWRIIFVKEFIDKTSEQQGTALNREAMMALQGFQGKSVVFGENYIIETNSDGHTLTTTFNEDGSVTEVFVGEKTITLNTTFENNEITQEVVQ